MNKLKDVDKVQTTESSGYHVEVELETRGKQGVHSVSPLLSNIMLKLKAEE